MKVWSKGLGRIALTFNFNNAIITIEKGSDLPARNINAEVIKNRPVICGKTVDPVVWEFKIWLEDSDVIPLIKIALSKSVIKFIFKYFIKRTLFMFSSLKRRL